MIAAIRNSRQSLRVTAMVALAMALIPAASEARMINIQLCSADGEVRTISIPLEQDEGEDHCAKPCHACLSRKKNTAANRSA